MNSRHETGRLDSIFLMRTRLVFLALLVLASAPLRATDDSDQALVPGTTLTYDFEHLGRAWHGHTTKMEVYIPVDYDPDRQYPLLVWLGHTWGSHSVQPAVDVVGASGFVCAALPYRDIASEHTKHKSGWKTHWPHYQAMLEKLEHEVPNVHPGKRICGGYSSGGAAVLWSIAHSGGGFQDYFYAFMPGGSGWSMGALNSIKGRPMLMFMGDQDTRYKGFEKLYRVAQTTGVDVELLVFEGIGHDLPAGYFPQMREWALRKVVHRSLPEAEAVIDRALRTGQWESALPAIREVLDSAEPSMPVYAKAQNAKQHACRASEEVLGRLLASNASFERLDEFIHDWRGCSSYERAAKACDALGRERLDVILQGTGRAVESRLRAFIEKYRDYPVHRAAIAELDRLAYPQLEQINQDPNLHRRAKRYAAFADKWELTSSATSAMRLRNELADKFFQDAMAVEEPPARARKLKAFARSWAGTSAADRAIEARELLAKQELDAINRIERTSTRRGRLRAFVRAFADTEAGHQAKRLLES